MVEKIFPKSTERISTSSIFQQTSFWAKVKQNQGFDAIAFDYQIHEDYKKLIDDVLVILRPAGNSYTIAYVPYGPVFEPEEQYQGLFLEDLSEQIRPHLPKNCILIRYDLHWQSPWVFDENLYNPDGIWTGPPDPRIQEMKMNFDTHHGNIRKSPTDILPSCTLFINLKKEKDQLLEEMKPKTRYNIRLSKRRGVVVRERGIEALPAWYELYKTTCSRNGIVLDSFDYFKTLLNTDRETQDSTARVKLLIAEYQEKPLAGLFLVLNNKRATYLYGASGTEKRNLMPTYALQWEAMQLARRKECMTYDFFGISQVPLKSHPLYGLYRYKTGFGGERHTRQGCWDYPLKEDIYETYKSFERSQQGYHIK